MVVNEEINTYGLKQQIYIYISCSYYASKVLGGGVARQPASHATTEVNEDTTIFDWQHLDHAGYMASEAEEECTASWSSYCCATGLAVTLQH